MPVAHRRRITISVLAPTVLVMLVGATPARAGQFEVATCQADRLNYGTQAFGDFATRGMKIRRACNPEGTGLRGLVTSNVIRRARIDRGSMAAATIKAPPGTTFTTFRWAGSARRVDCRYSLQLYADVPGRNPIPIKNVRANQGCPPARRSQASAYRLRSFDVRGATSIVQRVVCSGGEGRSSCSAAASNYIRTYQAKVTIADEAGPSVAVTPDSALGRGEWVSGAQRLAYAASDNVGVRSAQAIVAGQRGGSDQRDCQMASPDGQYAQGVPCPSGAGQINVDTTAFPEGTQPLVVQAQDTAGNVGGSPASTVRIDNTAPGRVEAQLEGGEGWRKTAGAVLRWSNPAETDRSPIVAASYKLCPAAGGDCTTGKADGPDVAQLSASAPSPGDWTLTMWRRDAAGNESGASASVAKHLRFDPEAPRVVFDPSEAGDPTKVGVTVTDEVSGLGDGTIEIGKIGSGAWQALPTEKNGGHLVAHLDDAGLPAGTYALRARATDQAGNESSTDRRSDGQPMVVTLPLRADTRLTVGYPRKKSGSKRTKLLSSRVIRRGRTATLTGRLTSKEGQGIGGAPIQVVARIAGGAEQLIATLSSRADGRFGYSARGDSSRTLDFRYPGTSVTLPVRKSVEVKVPASTTAGVSRRRVLNGDQVQFSGRVLTQPLPAAGKLVELQVKLSGKYQTFRTQPSAADGRWTIPYRFKRIRGIQHFSFRARVPAESGYPFSVGYSNQIYVQVRGQ